MDFTRYFEDDQLIYEILTEGSEEHGEAVTSEEVYSEALQPNPPTVFVPGPASSSELSLPTSL